MYFAFVLYCLQFQKLLKNFFFYTDRYDTNRKHQQSFPDNIHYKKHHTTTQTTNNPITFQSKSFHHSFKKIKKKNLKPYTQKSIQIDIHSSQSSPDLHVDKYEYTHVVNNCHPSCRSTSPPSPARIWARVICGQPSRDVPT